MFQRSLPLILSIAAVFTSCHAEDAWKGHQPTFTAQQSGTTQLLISVSPVNSRVVWAAGAGGTYVGHNGRGFYVEVRSCARS